MTLIQIILGANNASNLSFRRPKKPVLRLSNGLHSDHRDFARTPFNSFEIANGPSEGQAVLLSLESYEAQDWELVDC